MSDNKQMSIWQKKDYVLVSLFNGFIKIGITHSFKDASSTKPKVE